MKGYCDKCGSPIWISIAIQNSCGPTYGACEGCVVEGRINDMLSAFVYCCYRCGGVNKIYNPPVKATV